MAKNLSPYRYINGLKEGIPIGLGYLSVAFGLGITAVSMGIKALEALLVSMTCMTSAGQLAGFVIIASSGTIMEMILAQIVINLRYALMGISLTQRLDDRCTTPKRLLMAFGISDENFVLASSKPYSVGPSYFYGLMTFPYIGWSLGTLLGALAGQILPNDLQMALGIMIYAMFIAIIVPPACKSRGVLGTILISVALSCCLKYIPVFSFVSNGFSIIICALIAACVMALLCPVENEETNEKEEKTNVT